MRKEIVNILERKYLCRSQFINDIIEMLTDFKFYNSALYVFGHSGTGKSAIIKDLLDLLKCFSHKRFAFVNCIECYTTKLLLERLVDDLLKETDNECHLRCDNIKQFIDHLRFFNINQKNDYIIVFDNAERLRDMDLNVLPSFLRLQEITGVNLCVILISQLPWEKYLKKSGLPEIVPIHCPQYNKSEVIQILSNRFEVSRNLLKKQILCKETNTKLLNHKLQIIENTSKEFYVNYLNIFLSVFYKACRYLPELQTIAQMCFLNYIEPVINDTLTIIDMARLWRNVAIPFRNALTQVYVRLEKFEKLDCIRYDIGCKQFSESILKLVQSLDLPFYGKVLLIAAFIASHNSTKYDKHLFVNHQRKQCKRMQSANLSKKVTEKLSTSLGPKSFNIDRLLAIFYAIIDEKIGLTCNLLSQISTLVHLKLLIFVGTENNIFDGATRLQCTVGVEFIMYIGKMMDFNVSQYLSDFLN